MFALRLSIRVTPELLSDDVRMVELWSLGEVPERTNGTVLKTVEGQPSVGSNPTLPAILHGQMPNTYLDRVGQLSFPSSGGPHMSADDSHQQSDTNTSAAPGRHQVDPTTLTVRVDLEVSTPPIWRRLEGSFGAPSRRVRHDHPDRLWPDQLPSL